MAGYFGDPAGSNLSSAIGRAKRKKMGLDEDDMAAPSASPEVSPNDEEDDDLFSKIKSMLRLRTNKKGQAAIGDE